MSRIQSISLLAALLSASQVAAHGHALALIANGVSYQGWDTDSFPYMPDPPKVAAWSTPNLGNGFVSPSKYGTEDIICHQDAKNAEGYVEVAAGDRVQVQWTDWPESHHGPVIDYLANCGESCTTVDKTTLEFFKIDGVGYESGTWGDDQLIANDNSWMVEIPKSIAPGNYVLRHELIALHSAGDVDGAQSYPQCFNLKVTGSGTDKPAGVVGTMLYTASDPGILFNIYGDASSYEVPGPALYSGAVSIKQTTSAVTATGTATTGPAAVNTAIAVPSTTFMTIPVRAPSATTSATPSSSSAPSSSSSVPYPSSTPTSSPTPTVAPGGTQQVYGQCGGKNWTGGSTCAAGSTCKVWNPYYSQCIPVEFE